MSTKKLLFGIVEDNYSVAKGIYYLSIGTDLRSISLKAGNFIHLSCSGRNPTILRRPFSIFKAEDNSISILYKIVGKGTENLSHLKKGDKVDFIVPCGNSFNISLIDNNIALIAGGIGIAPIGFLLRTFQDLSFTGKVFLYYGVTSEEERIPLSLLSLKGIECFLHSDYKDGIFDKNLFEFFRENEVDDFLHTFICGPKDMLRVFADYLVKKGKIVQVSLEENMACGIGACFGCTIKTKDGLKRVCTDGPIFYGERIDFGSL